MVAPQKNAGRGLKLQKTGHATLLFCRPAEERGARIETFEGWRKVSRSWVAPQKNAGRGLKHDLPGGAVVEISRPAEERGARIETNHLLLDLGQLSGRPAEERGARIET